MTALVTPPNLILLNRLFVVVGAPARHCTFAGLDIARTTESALGVRDWRGRVVWLKCPLTGGIPKLALITSDAFEASAGLMNTGMVGGLYKVAVSSTHDVIIHERTVYAATAMY